MAEQGDRHVGAVFSAFVIAVCVAFGAWAYMGGMDTSGLPNVEMAPLDIDTPSPVLPPRAES
jgi:hypothetical protein